MLESNYSKSLHLGSIKKTVKKIKEDHLKKTNKITIINENSDTRPALIKSLNDLYVISNQDRELLDIPLFFTPFEYIIPNGEIDNFNNGFAQAIVLY